MSLQQQLFGVKIAADHSNQGKEFEDHLEGVHDWYRLQGWADVRKIPSNWKFISSDAYLKLAGKLPKNQLAKTEDGRFMQRVKSDVDFSGGGKSFSIAFDAKTCSKKVFPLDSVEAHQLAKMRDRAKCRMIAGAMVWMTAFDRVFFVPYKYLEARQTILLRQTGRRAKPGTASISLADLELHATEIPKNKMNMNWDWLKVIVTH